MKRFALFVAFLMVIGLAWAQEETPAQREARMAWWREARFGMFIHWGPVSLKGTEIGWSRMEPDRTGFEKRMHIGHKGNTIYLHVFDWPGAGVTLPDPQKKIEAARLLGQGPVEMRRGNEGVLLQLPENRRDPVDTIVELTLNGPAGAIAPVRLAGFK